jgi:hypothetical protein
MIGQGENFKIRVEREGSIIEERLRNASYKLLVSLLCPLRGIPRAKERKNESQHWIIEKEEERELGGEFSSPIE